MDPGSVETTVVQGFVPGLGAGRSRRSAPRQVSVAQYGAAWIMTCVLLGDQRDLTAVLHMIVALLVTIAGIGTSCPR